MQLRTIRSKVILVGLVVAVAAAATGCSTSPSASPTKSAAPKSTGVVTITFAHANFTDPGQGPGLLKLLAEFNSTHKNIIVKPAAIPEPVFAQTIATQLAAGEGPDVIRFDSGPFYQSAAAGFLEPLTKVVDAKKLDLYPAQDKYSFLNGTRYGAIASTTPYLLLYNTSLIKTPPKTFPQLLSDAKAATKNGVYGFAVRQTLPEEAGMWQDLNNYVYGFGGAWSNGKKLTLNSAKTIQGLEAYQNLYNANVIPKGATAATYRQMFAQGQIAMMIDNGGVPGAELGINPKIKFAAAPVPMPVQKSGEILDLFSVNAKSKHIAAANTFLAWLLSKQGQVAFQEATPGDITAAPVTLPTSAQALVPPQDAEYRKEAAIGVPQLVPGFYSQTPQITDIVVKQVLSALAGTVTMKQAMNQAQTLAEQAVKG
jgi:multiple sugar transport system substrate-binding protein